MENPPPSQWPPIPGQPKPQPIIPAEQLAEPLTTQQVRSASGRYALVSPVRGGIQFWEINDMEKEYAVFSRSVHFSDAEDVSREEFKKYADK
jgi:hypothetical protein